MSYREDLTRMIWGNVNFYIPLDVKCGNVVEDDGKVVVYEINGKKLFIPKIVFKNALDFLFMGNAEKMVVLGLHGKGRSYMLIINPHRMEFRDEYGVHKEIIGKLFDMDEDEFGQRFKCLMSDDCEYMRDDEDGNLIFNLDIFSDINKEFFVYYGDVNFKMAFGELNEVLEKWLGKWFVE